MEFEAILNYITGSGFLTVLVAAGLFLFSLAYFMSKYIEKKEYERYAGIILCLGFLLVCISFLTTQGKPVLPLKVLYYATYVSGMICAFVAPGLYVKKIFPKKLSPLIMAAPSFAIPFFFYKCQGNQCGTEYVTINLYYLDPLFEYFGAVMTAVMAFGLIGLLCIALKTGNLTEKILKVVPVIILCLFSLFSGLITGTLLASVYFYQAFKESGIKVGGRSALILFAAAGAIVLLLPVLEENSIFCVNACTYGLLEILAFTFVILGTINILEGNKSLPGNPPSV